MKFLDQAKIYIKAGDGGNGACSFRHEKFLEFGGPDGELAASMRYISQRYAMPYRDVAGTLTITILQIPLPLLTTQSAEHLMIKQTPLLSTLLILQILLTILIIYISFK